MLQCPYISSGDNESQDDRVEVKRKIKHPCDVIGRAHGTVYHSLSVNCYYHYHHYYRLLVRTKRGTDTENYTQSYLNIP